MKQLIRNIKKKDKIVLSLLLGAALIIWFGGPALVIGNQYPLQQGEKRFYIIALIFLVWILKFIFTPPKQKKTVSAATPETPEANARLQALQGRFQGAVLFLKKSMISKNNKNISLSHLPWYLMIGPQGAGKTSLLANSNINFTLAKQFKDKITPSEACDWWATRDLVIVDVPGSYFKEKNHYLWNNFLSLTQENSKQSAISAVVIALPLPELIKQQNSQQKKQIVSDIKHKITQLRAQLGNELSFYIVITKCDQLPGFVEFFGESGTEELAQAWGIPLPTRKENEKLLDIVITRFNALIKRLNSQLILRLHQERNPNARPAIKDFPLQVERLKDMTGQFIKALNIPDLKLCGIYLTSALQANTEEQTTQSQIIQANPTQALQLFRNAPLPSKAYFIRHFILQGLLCSGDIPAPVIPSKKARWTRRFAYVLATMTVITATLLLGRDFQQSVLQTYAIQNDLTQYRLSIQEPNHNGDNLLKALPLLNALQMTASRTNNNLSRFASLLSFYSDKSQKTATTVYQQALQTIVLPEIKNSLENNLRNNSKNPAQLYAVLKAYLMLSDKQTLQMDYVTKILMQLLPSSSNPQTNSDLISHIQAAFDQASQPVEINNDLVAQVRSQLKNLPSLELGLVILKNMGNNNTDSTINLGATLANPPVFVNSQITNRIPILYTANAYQAVTEQQVAIAATESLQGNPIIGPFDILSNEATINALMEQLRTRYIANYVDIWENQLANLKLTTPNNLTTTDTLAANLMSNASPLLQLLKTIRENTSFAPILSASPKLQALNNLLGNAHNNEENSLYQIFVNLRQLHFYLQNILTSRDVGQAAFDAAKNRMLTPTHDPISELRLLALDSPEPMRSWLNTLAVNSWYYILQETSHFIENAWQINVFSIYHSQIANVDSQELDLQQVANFIGKTGTLANFYQRYLKPFANDTTKQWQWRVVENQKLPFAANVLEQIQEASKLQNMSKYKLFTQGRTNPAVLQLRLPEKLLVQAKS
ncbi:MAG: type VI secretion system membrane subunit TssM [Gammaproteobacteria bacterium]